MDKELHCGGANLKIVTLGKLHWVYLTQAVLITVLKELLQMQLKDSPYSTADKEVVQILKCLQQTSKGGNIFEHLLGCMWSRGSVGTSRFPVKS